MSATSNGASPPGRGGAFDRAAEEKKEKEKKEEEGGVVKHVVVLMLENRSFDNALGYLDSHHPFHGLSGGSGSHLSPAEAEEAQRKTGQDGRRGGPTPDDLVDMNRDYFNTCSSTTGEERVWPEPRAQFFTPVDPPHSHAEIMEQMYGEGRVPSFDRVSGSSPPKVQFSYLIELIYPKTDKFEFKFS
jgi:hypothetical protein